MVPESIKKICEGGLIYKSSNFALWAGDDWGPVLVIKQDEEPVECDQCGEEPEIDHPYGIKFRTDIRVEPEKPVASTITLSYASEEKRDEYFDHLNEEQVSAIYKEMSDVLGGIGTDEPKGE